jgi:hypothetical protein
LFINCIQVDRLLQRAEAHGHDSSAALHRVDRSINSVRSQISEFLQEEERLARAVEQASVKAAHFDQEVQMASAMQHVLMAYDGR